MKFITLYDFANTKRTFNLPVGKGVTEIQIDVISGDKVATVMFDDNTFETYDVGVNRLMDFYDGSYTIRPEQIEEWENYIPFDVETISYGRYVYFTKEAIQ